MVKSPAGASNKVWSEHVNDVALQQPIRQQECSKTRFESRQFGRLIEISRLEVDSTHHRRAVPALGLKLEEKT